MKKDNHYVAWGLTAVAVVCTILLFYDIVFRHSIILVYLNKLIAILAPVLYGFAMAYLLTPVVNWFERSISAMVAAVLPPNGCGLCPFC